MFRTTFSFLIAIPLLLSACTTTGKPKSNLAILSARYGIEDRRVDVAEAVRSIVENDQIRLRAPWGLGLIDPAAGIVKDVQIVYRFHGAEHTAMFTQHQDIILPAVHSRPDPVLGRWRWMNSYTIIEVRSDGTLSSADHSGTWKSRGQRRYEFNWDRGAAIDTVSLSGNEKKLTGKNENSVEVWGDRIK